MIPSGCSSASRSSRSRLLKARIHRETLASCVADPLFVEVLESNVIGLAWLVGVLERFELGMGQGALDLSAAP